MICITLGQALPTSMRGLEISWKYIRSPGNRSQFPWRKWSFWKVTLWHQTLLKFLLKSCPSLVPPSKCPAGNHIQDCTQREITQFNVPLQWKLVISGWDRTFSPIHSGSSALATFFFLLSMANNSKMAYPRCSLKQHSSFYYFKILSLAFCFGQPKGSQTLQLKTHRKFHHQLPTIRKKNISIKLWLKG